MTTLTDKEAREWAERNKTGYGDVSRAAQYILSHIRATSPAQAEGHRSTAVSETVRDLRRVRDSLSKPGQEIYQIISTAIILFTEPQEPEAQAAQGLTEETDDREEAEAIVAWMRGGGHTEENDNGLSDTQCADHIQSVLERVRAQQRSKMYVNYKKKIDILTAPQPQRMPTREQELLDHLRKDLEGFEHVAEECDDETWYDISVGDDIERLRALLTSPAAEKRK